MKNKTILLISPEAWGTNFVSKHHYANYLAKHNTVYFLNPVLGSIVNPFGNVNAEIKPIKDNLFQVNYQNLLPRLNTLPKFIQQFIFKKQAKQIQTVLNIAKFDIVWSFDPYRFWNQNVWSADKTIYHAVDPHKARFEKEIIKASNLFVAVSEVLLNKLNNVKISSIKIGHGLHISDSIYDFDLKIENNEKKIGYLGNLNGKLIDTKMLKDIILKFSGNIFYFLGPIKSNNLSLDENIDWVHFLSSKKNVVLLGEMCPDKINTFLSKMDILLLCYFPLKSGNTPHKILEYLYSGKEIVSNEISEYIDYPEMINFNKGNDKLGYEKILASLLNEKKSSIKTINKAFALNNTYNKKIEKISNALYL